MLSAYARLKLEELGASARTTHPKVRRTALLGWDVHFVDHYWLVEMFEEIFLREQYYFETESAAPLIVDVGSNIGLSVLYFKRLFPRARIVAFEPDPATFEVLSANVRGNGLPDVAVVNEAVYDGVESVVLYGDPRAPSSPQQSTRKARMLGGERRVPATRLSEYVSEPLDFLKLDVEGAELVVLSELEKSGKLSLVRRLTLEYHHHLVGEEEELGAILSMLERSDFGYQLEARAGFGRDERVYQNVLVHAYAKGQGT